MKFTGARAERERRSRSVDVIGRPEEEIESEFFDPRVDFPAEELTRLKQLASDLEAGGNEESAFEDLRISWWLGLVDQEYNKLLHADPEFSEFLWQKYKAYFDRISGDRYSGPVGAMLQSIPAIQLYPALRDSIRKEFFDVELPSLTLAKREVEGPDLYKATMSLRNLLLLYPDRRKEWLDTFSIHPEEVIARLQDGLEDKWLSSDNKALITASLLLAFPELRPKILSILPDQKKWTQAFKEARRPYEHYNHEFAFDLTVIGAESARVDEKGQIQLQLKPRSMSKAQRPLPERLSA